MSKPKFLYKYRSIKNTKSLINDYAIDALFKCYSIFSNRRNFNDLFDTKINFINPSPKEFKNIIHKLPKNRKKFMLKYINKGSFTQNGMQFLETVKTLLNDVIDTYAIFSLSSRDDCNLMWSHYADSHFGFCIEFNSEYMQVNKIDYQDDIAELYLSDFLLFHFKLEDETVIDDRIKNLLIQKLIYWNYEDEYRIIASKSLGSIKLGENFTKIKYSAKFVNSIIFGVRMENRVKQFIMNNFPFKTDFKQAVEGKNKVKIVPFNPNRHLQ